MHDQPLFWNRVEENREETKREEEFFENVLREERTQKAALQCCATLSTLLDEMARTLLESDGLKAQGWSKRAQLQLSCYAQACAKPSSIIFSFSSSEKKKRYLGPDANCLFQVSLSPTVRDSFIFCKYTMVKCQVSCGVSFCDTLGATSFSKQAQDSSTHQTVARDFYFFFVLLQLHCCLVQFFLFFLSLRY